MADKRNKAEPTEVSWRDPSVPDTIRILMLISAVEKLTERVEGLERDALDIPHRIGPPVIR